MTSDQLMTVNKGVFFQNADSWDATKERSSVHSDRVLSMWHGLFCTHTHIYACCPALTMSLLFCIINREFLRFKLLLKNSARLCASNHFGKGERVDPTQKKEETEEKSPLVDFFKCCLHLTPCSF